MKEIDSKTIHDIKNISVKLTYLTDLYTDGDINIEEFYEFLSEIRDKITQLCD